MIYLDHNASTPILPEVLEAMLPWLSRQWGNPSSIHKAGRLARQAIEKAREQLADLVGAHPTQIVFTSGATEANNTAINSALLSSPAKKHIITSSVEHAAVLSYCAYLERHHQVELTCLPVDEAGMISLHDLKSAFRPDTAIVSLMWANNETGVIAPLKELALACAERGVAFHTDAVQAVGKIVVNFTDSRAALLSLSGHKIGAPKGIGAVLIADTERFQPLLIGGNQEQGHRGGTENVPHIVALGTAAEIAKQRLHSVWQTVADLRDAFEQETLKCIRGSQVNGGTSLRLPNTSNLYLPGMDSDALATFLDQREICISSGSACLQSAITPSHVVLAMTGSHETASQSIRVSLGPKSTKEDITHLLQAVKDFADLTG